MANVTVTSAQTTTGPSAASAALTGPCTLKFSGVQKSTVYVGMSETTSGFVPSGIVMTEEGMVYLNCPGTYYLNVTISAVTTPESVTVVAIQ